MEPFDSLIIPAVVLAIMVGNHHLRERARRRALENGTAASEIEETSADKTIRVAGEVIATLAWLTGTVMSFFVIGFTRSDDSVATLATLLAFYGLIPIAVSAVIFAMADRHLRPKTRTIAYVFMWWALVLTFPLVGFFARK